MCARPTARPLPRCRVDATRMRPIRPLAVSYVSSLPGAAGGVAVLIRPVICTPQKIRTRARRALVEANFSALDASLPERPSALLVPAGRCCCLSTKFLGVSRFPETVLSDKMPSRALSIRRGRTISDASSWRRGGARLGAWRGVAGSNAETAEHRQTNAAEHVKLGRKQPSVKEWRGGARGEDLQAVCTISS